MKQTIASSYYKKSFAYQKHNLDSDINELGETQQAVNMYLKIKACVRVFRQNKVWQAPRGSTAVQTLPNHILFLLPQHFDDTDLFLYVNNPLCTL